MATRREFIKKGSLATMIAVSTGVVCNSKVFGANGYFSLPKVSNDTVNGFTEDNFKPLIATVFDVKNTEANTFGKLKLIEVTSVDFQSKFQNQQTSNSFSLLFEGISGTHLEQDNYQFNHPKLGKVKLFLVPVSPDANVYEVIFNNSIR